MSPSGGDGSDVASPAGRVDAVPVEGGALRRRIRGRGPPLLCLHGLSAHGGVWRAVARRLEGRFTLHVPDLLSRGRSDARPDVAYTLERELARLGPLVEGLPDRGYLVAGHSQGAALAVALAAAAGDAHLPRPAGLALAAPVTPWTRRPRTLEALRSAAVRRALAPVLSALRRPLTRWVLRHRAFSDPERVDAGTVRRYAAPWRDVRRARALLRVLADWRPDDLSGHVPGRPPPTRVVAGARDRRVPPDQARRWARELGAGFGVAGDAGHVVPEERPGRVAEAIRRVAGAAGG